MFSANPIAREQRRFEDDVGGSQHASEFSVRTRLLRQVLAKRPCNREAVAIRAIPSSATSSSRLQSAGLRYLRALTAAEALLVTRRDWWP
jgi:hypothetical protein